MADEPPMDPNTDEATAEQLDYARAQGEAYGDALHLMAQKVADDGGKKRSGEYLIGYAIEEAEGLYRFDRGELTWEEPTGRNVHVEVAVRDAADGRFIPGLDVEATLRRDGEDLGTHKQDLVWHPMLYHYAHNWQVSGDGGRYELEVRFDPPRFRRHDKINGRRFTEPGHVVFQDVAIGPETD
jgi:hypothetical protein